MSSCIHSVRLAPESTVARTQVAITYRRELRWGCVVLIIFVIKHHALVHFLLRRNNLILRRTRSKVSLPLLMHSRWLLSLTYCLRFRIRVARRPFHSRSRFFLRILRCAVRLDWRRLGIRLGGSLEPLERCGINLWRVCYSLITVQGDSESV